jgi:prepilin-type N-terminal cleavage/methylation domain-containing protein
MKKNQSGFTLIEIAIVMVIIGLLLGGVLKGQAMINSAKVRSLNNNIDGVTAAWFAFQDRYRAFPGDLSIANAQSQIDAGVTHGGNGNGVIGAGPEAGAVWEQLAAAGFISGSYTGLTTGQVYSCPTTVCPDNRFGLGFVIASAAVTFPAPAAHHLYTGSNIPVTIVAEVDRKIDDGDPTTGTVRGGTNNGAAAACLTGATYNIAGASGDCGLALNNL